MKITISKILNKTDLAESGSHGGLVVTRTAKKMLMDFFESSGQEHNFIDKDDAEEFPIHYVDYTSNGTTPNDRITPIGKYASKHDLTPGDILIFQKDDDGGTKQYFIEYARRLKSAYFVGKSSKSVEALNFEQFVKIVTDNVSSGKIRRMVPNSCLMDVKYQGVMGELSVVQNADGFEMYFNDVHIEEHYKYFELDTSVEPFELRKTDTWKLEVSTDSDNSEVNEEADDALVKDISQRNINESTVEYTPLPEEKKPAKMLNGRTTPNRDRNRANNALARAGFLCEYDNAHELFIRKSQPINYTEPHHLIPLKFDSLFEKSLDVEANIVSLCSNCHDLIHYGADAERVIRKLWEERKDELKAAGLGVMKNGVELTVDILLSFYGIK